MDQDYASALNDYSAHMEWLNSLITDKTGAHYLQEKRREAQMAEFRETLARTTDFLDFAGRPQEKFNSIHVAGTSGKGSVVSFISSILQNCGLRTAHHVNPFLQVCTEKLIRNGQRIALTEFNELVNNFRALYNRWQSAGRAYDSLKYHEAWTALALVWFANVQAEWAVVETGVGGRFDPSNVLPSKLAVITNVDYDHVQVLGPTIEDIAYHKAGIIKKGQPALTASTRPEVMEVLTSEAQSQNSPLFCIGRDFRFQIHNVDDQGLDLSVEAPYHRYANLHVGSLGLFQAENVALAVSAVDVLAKHYGLSLTKDGIETALETTKISGRMEVVQREPLVILDGAHNPHKMGSLVSSLRAIYPNKSITFIIGMLGTKDTKAMLETLVPLADRIFATKPYVLGKPSVEPDELVNYIHEIDIVKEVLPMENVREAIQAALDTAPKDDLIVITGSLYMLGDARDYWIPRETMLHP